MVSFKRFAAFGLLAVASTPTVLASPTAETLEKKQLLGLCKLDVCLASITSLTGPLSGAQLAMQACVLGQLQNPTTAVQCLLTAVLAGVVLPIQCPPICLLFGGLGL